jgi:hypothetical protein
VVNPKLAADLLQEVRRTAAALDRDITDGHERQAVITEAAFTLAQAGLWKDSDALLKANLPKSHSPYYLMSELADNARKQGRTAEALGWYRRAFDGSVGPATRLQWGATYLAALVELQPGDAAKIEALASELLREAGAQESAFYERSGRALKKVGSQLEAWGAKGQHSAALSRLRAQLAPMCGKLPEGEGQKLACTSLIKA